MSDNIFKYFPSLSDTQKGKISQLKNIYDRWNNSINVISRKDMDNFWVHHVLHSLAIAKVISFQPRTQILDVGTGGGFPGIPLAIMFPESEFTLLDSIEKKIKVVSSVVNELKLENVSPVRKRVEDEKGKYHFIISRAVTGLPKFVTMTEKNIETKGSNNLKNGILYLKGGDLTAELIHLQDRVKTWNITEFFNEQFFETKKVVYLSL